MRKRNSFLIFSGMTVVAERGGNVYISAHFCTVRSVPKLSIIAYVPSVNHTLFLTVLGTQKLAYPCNYSTWIHSSG